MKNNKSKGLSKILLIIIVLISIPLVFIALFAGTYLFSKANQISKVEADQKCYKFAKDVKSDISSVQGYTIIGEKTLCRPDQDEAGFTDYYFTATYKVTKSDNISVDSQKTNINYLANKIPLKNYLLWVDNIPPTDGQAPAICVTATSQIQEDGSSYQSNGPAHFPRYTEPGTIKDFQPCKDI